MTNEIWSGFEHGIGIGGWLTNYKRFNVLPDKWKMPLTIGDYEHFETYITEADIQYIVSLKADHVRMCFDQLVLEESPGVYRERTFTLLDRFLDWCGKYGLNVVMNLHKAIGNFSDVPSDGNLFDDNGLQERFAAFWCECERRWHDRPEVVFELLNEVNPTGENAAEKWNNLASRTIKAIRRLNPDRRIVIGSVLGNSPTKLKDLKVYDDPNIIYTFHFYLPHSFTHQRAVLWDAQLFYNRIMPYPGDIERYRDFEKVIWNNDNSYPGFDKMDIRYLNSEMQGAFDFQTAHPDKILWLGEFGTIRHCPLEYRENWMRDVISLAKTHGIPYCAWNYLSTPNDGNKFSLVDDDHRKIVSERMAQIISGSDFKS